MRNYAHRIWNRRNRQAFGLVKCQWQLPLGEDFLDACWANHLHALGFTISGAGNLCDIVNTRVVACNKSDVSADAPQPQAFNWSEYRLYIDMSLTATSSTFSTEDVRKTVLDN